MLLCISQKICLTVIRTLKRSVKSQCVLSKNRRVLFQLREDSCLPCFFWCCDKVPQFRWDACSGSQSHVIIRLAGDFKTVGTWHRQSPCTVENIERRYVPYEHSACLSHSQNLIFHPTGIVPPRVNRPSHHFSRSFTVDTAQATPKYLVFSHTWNLDLTPPPTHTHTFMHLPCE